MIPHRYLIGKRCSEESQSPLLSLPMASLFSSRYPFLRVREGYKWDKLATQEPDNWWGDHQSRHCQITLGSVDCTAPIREWEGRCDGLCEGIEGDTEYSLDPDWMFQCKHSLLCVNGEERRDEKEWVSRMRKEMRVFDKSHQLQWEERGKWEIGRVLQAFYGKHSIIFSLFTSFCFFSYCSDLDLLSSTVCWG